MQYGNEKEGAYATFFIDSLNRTMQYGNEDQKGGKLSLGFWFKSYYVVWKLVYDTPEDDIKKKFKSYYVVWKHERT